MIKTNDIQSLAGVTKQVDQILDDSQRGELGIGGVGYSWVNEKDNRALGVTYTNTSDKPIGIVISIRADAASSFADLQVSGTPVGTLGTHTQAGSNGYFSQFFIVPSGGTAIALPTGTLVLNKWSELK